MKKLIEALHVIQEECKKHTGDGDYHCEDCPMSFDEGRQCAINDLTPNDWKINDEIQKALL